MENLIKVQEEFEKLIGQLEKLKEINKLSSLNTETAKNVINHIEGFTRSVDEFKKKINDDYELKSIATNKLLKDFETGIENIESAAKGLHAYLSNLMTDFKQETSTTLDLYFNKLNSTLDVSKSELNDKLNNIIIELDKNQLINLKGFRSMKIMLGLLYILIILVAFGIVYILY